MSPASERLHLIPNGISQHKTERLWEVPHKDPHTMCSCHGTTPFVSFPSANSHRTTAGRYPEPWWFCNSLAGVVFRRRWTPPPPCRRCAATSVFADLTHSSLSTIVMASHWSVVVARQVFDSGNTLWCHFLSPPLHRRRLWCSVSTESSERRDFYIVLIDLQLIAPQLLSMSWSWSLPETLSAQILQQLHVNLAAFGKLELEIPSLKSLTNA